MVLYKKVVRDLKVSFTSLQGILTSFVFLSSVLQDIIIPVKAQVEWVSFKTKTKAITYRLDIPANLKP